MNSKKPPFIYQSFFKFWLVIVLPACIAALTVSKLYYNGTINSEPLSQPSTWFYFIFIQVILGFFSYLWVYRAKAKSFRK
ncbi:hypothetical protein [Algoriphagus halophilus]|uniref:hypothetical protein n=1 Tax=Algoriphagus halophilus TaxID=226505 RepID=UPI0009417A02|nr:hypothetical protein [Algoriphagus halophilus]